MQNNPIHGIKLYKISVISYLSGIYNKIDVQALKKAVNKLKNTVLVTPADGHLRVLLMDNPAQKVFVIWLNGLEMTVYEQKSANGILIK